MILISHRGNIDGPKPELENSPEYIQKALDQGYDCEIDLWHKDDKFWLGHDEPQYEIDQSFLFNDRLWIHCKNKEALGKMLNISNCFWHDTDDYTITSQGYVWAYPGKEPTGSKCICVKPETTKISREWFGVCSDYINMF